EGLLRPLCDARQSFCVRLASEASANRFGRLRKLELGLHLRSHVRRSDGRLLQLRDESGGQRTTFEESGGRAGEAEVARRRRELRAGDRLVLAGGHRRY